ncbi:hypothetical protein GOBAR_DD06585 [Gossypium barbadense]|nr:hypothetical protein GOBAR_DD06585 [Gossypium barbadense]
MRHDRASSSHIIDAKTWTRIDQLKQGTNELKLRVIPRKWLMAIDVTYDPIWKKLKAVNGGGSKILVDSPEIVEALAIELWANLALKQEGDVFFYLLRQPPSSLGHILDKDGLPAMLG